MYSDAKFIGRVVRESNGVKHVGDNNTPLYENSIAYDRGWGEKKKTCFLDFKIWGKRAEVFHTYVRKGNRIFLSGELDQEKWEDKENNKRSKHVLIVNNFIFIESASDDNAKPKEAEVDDFDDPGSVPF